MTDLREQLAATLSGAYTVERELGGGGMSRVFLAEERALGRRVVLKLLPPELTVGVNVERFKREIQLAAKLQHPHIVPVLSTGELDGMPYYTMPYVDGESLRDRIGRFGPLGVGEAVGILRDVAKALAYAHERGIVHRDIKPANVLLSGGSAAVADFGIAKALDAARVGEQVASAESRNMGSLTALGTALGTPAYMAPEQAAADPSANHRADIYSFGCLAYEVLTGRAPFVATSPQRLLAAHMSDTPQPVSELRMDVPADLAALVMRCLAKDAQERPSATELVHTLDTVTSGGAHAALPPILVGGAAMFRKSLLAYVVALVATTLVAQAAVIGIGLPDWVVPGTTVVMLLGLPVILFTGYVQRVVRRAATVTPSYTPGGTPSLQHGTLATLALKASPHVSWQRTWMGGAVAVGTFTLLIGGYMALRALGIGPAGSLLATGALQKNERLLIADFSSSASDSTIGPLVTDAFRTALGQSRTIGIFQPNDLREVLRRMQRPVDTPVDFAVAREVATREGIRAVVLGDVIAFGGNFAISVRLVSPQTGQELASFRQTANSERALLPAIDKLAKDVRARIGESLRTVQATLPLERVTTPSLEALKKYVQGSRAMSFEADFAKGAALLEEAIALDTGFAMAYRRLAVEYTNRQQPDRGAALLQKAYEHSNRLSDAERYLVLGSYYAGGPRQDIAKSTSAYETLLELQPDFITALNNVSINYRWQRNFAKAEQNLKRVIAVGPAPVVAYNQLAWTLWDMGKHREAWEHMARFDSVYPTNPQRLFRWVELLTAAGRYDSAAVVAAQVFREWPNDVPLRAVATGRLSAIARTQGRLAEASRFSAEAAALHTQRGAPQGSLTHASWEAAARLLIAGDRDRAVAVMDRAMAETPIERLPLTTRPYASVALVYGMAGRTDIARDLLARFRTSRQQVAQFDDVVDERLMRGAIAFGDSRYDEAAREFAAADQGECLSCALPLLALALDHGGKQDSALVVLERYFATDHAFRSLTDQHFLAIARRRAGELYEARGDHESALRHYLAFLDLWNRADPDLQPQVAAIRARVARLSDVEQGGRSGRP